MVDQSLLESTSCEIQKRLGHSPYIAAMGIIVDEVDAPNLSIRMRLPLSEGLERTKDSNQFHGGAIAALIDIAGDYAPFPLIKAGIPTINLRVDYLRPCFGPFITAIGTARKSGRLITVADVEVIDSNGALCALGRGCYASKAG